LRGKAISNDELL